MAVKKRYTSKVQEWRDTDPAFVLAEQLDTTLRHIKRVQIKTQDPQLIRFFWPEPQIKILRRACRWIRYNGKTRRVEEVLAGEAWLALAKKWEKYAERIDELYDESHEKVTENKKEGGVKDEKKE